MHQNVETDIRTSKVSSLTNDVSPFSIYLTWHIGSVELLNYRVI